MFAPVVVLAALASVSPPKNVTTRPAPDDPGKNIVVEFEGVEGEVTRYEVWRTIALPGAAEVAVAPDIDAPLWRKVKDVESSGPFKLTDEVPNGKLAYRYAVRSVVGAEGEEFSAFAFGGPEKPVRALFIKSHTSILLLVVLLLVLLAYFYEAAKKRAKQMYIRRIPAIDAMEEAIGRSTEMGRPVLYIPGIEEITDIQTIAGLMVLGHVAELVARYDTEIRVPCVYPLNMVIAEEIVRQGFYNAGRPDAHKPQNIQFISAEQFAFCAGVNGIMLREKPATNIFLGRFFAESLILAETGYVNRSVQIAGTAEITQLPFFIAACDYTLLGEEIFAVSAYLSREPRLLSTLKATDVMKLVILAFVLVGAVLNAQGVFDLGKWIAP